MKFILVLGLLIFGNHCSAQEPHDDLLEKILKDRDINENHYLLKSVKKINKTEDYRLPKTIVPEKYNVTVEVLLRAFNFSGLVEINATVIERTNEIALHYKNLTILECHIYNDNNEEVKIKATKYNNVTHIFTMILERYLTAKSKVLIAIKYEGVLSEDANGLYRSSYYDANGNRRWLATTQFEPVYARKAFPCFDEPGFKAKFTVHIRRPKNLTALSNMPLVSTRNYTDSALDTFAETPRMSSYIIAMVVSDFSSLSENGTNVHIWSKKALIKNGNFSLHFGTKVLDSFGKLFNFTNPVPKTDMIAVPDFAAGAMENWGLVTYREYLVIYDEKENSDFLQQSVGSTVAHELAHMWFGNLMSPEWWDFTWLNEGFANYFQHIGSILAEPSWKSGGLYLANIVRSALTYDSSEYSASISHESASPADISGLFGAITYQKGGSVIRMMAESFGPEIFYGALREYIAKHKFGNVRSEFLWKALQNQVDKKNPELKIPIERLMSNWINKPGHPVLNVKVKKNQIHLSQKRFLIGSKPGNETWYIPITFATQNNPNFTSAITNVWMNNSMTIELENASKQWIVFNRLSAGFYRVNYDLKSWYRIIRALNTRKSIIHEYNRVAIIDDLFSLARAELIDYDVVLDAMQYLSYETNYLPIKTALGRLNFLSSKFSGQEDEELLNTHIMNLVKNVYKKLGYHDSKTDSKYTIFLRVALNSLACKMNNSKCLSSAMKSFAKWRKEPLKKVPNNQRAITYCYAIQEGTSEDWEFLNNEYYKTDNVYERLIILKGLSCTRNETLIEKYLFKALNDYDWENQIHRQDSLSLFQSVAQNGFDGAKQMLRFLAKHQDKVVKYFKDNTSVVQLVLLASRSFTTMERINEFQRYIDENSVIYKPILPYLENIKKNALHELQWYEKHSDSIIKWLYKTYP